MPLKLERDSVTHGSATIEYSVVRSARRKRTITLRVLRGALEVLAPVRTPKRDIRAFVQAKAAWALDKLRNPSRPPDIPPFGCGDTVPYLGSDTSLLIEPGPVGAVEVSLHDDECNVPDTDPKFIYIGRKHFHVTVPANIDDGNGSSMSAMRWSGGTRNAPKNTSPKRSPSGCRTSHRGPSRRYASAMRGRSGGAARGTGCCASAGGA